MWSQHLFCTESLMWHNQKQANIPNFIAPSLIDKTHVTVMQNGFNKCWRGFVCLTWLRGQDEKAESQWGQWLRDFIHVHSSSPSPRLFFLRQDGNMDEFSGVCWSSRCFSHTSALCWMLCLHCCLLFCTWLFLRIHFLQEWSEMRLLHVLPCVTLHSSPSVTFKLSTVFFHCNDDALWVVRLVDDLLWINVSFVHCDCLCFIHSEPCVTLSSCACTLFVGGTITTCFQAGHSSDLLSHVEIFLWCRCNKKQRLTTMWSNSQLSQKSSCSCQLSASTRKSFETEPCRALFLWPLHFWQQPFCQKFACSNAVMKHFQWQEWHPSTTNTKCPSHCVLPLVPSVLNSRMFVVCCANSTRYKQKYAYSN